MANYVRRPNRFLRPKREHITPLDRVQGKLRSLMITSTVLLAGTGAKDSKHRIMPTKRRERAAASR